MEIRRHPDCTRDIGAPSDMTEKECAVLPVIDYTTEYGHFSMSFWKPDEFELAALNAGGAVALSIRTGSMQHPVVKVETTPDKTEPL